ncbi:uncharacterized protein LOC141820781 [Curcuma longa]|uniref:uncharacterized protein LOC141820781 n=1 Tax=Curcuma longa TaxID=136217 RepID=UPI003D9F9DD7
MKMLANGQARRVHPAPPPDFLEALPASLLALLAALTAEEQDVLAYLLSGGGERRIREWPPRWRAHPPELGCRCFGCYTSFWARWDASPNRQVIHHIIDAVEEGLASKERERGRQRRRSGGGHGGRKGAAFEPSATPEEGKADLHQLFPALDGGIAQYDDTSNSDEDGTAEAAAAAEEEMSDGDNSAINGISKSSVQRFMSFVGERVWGVGN